MILNTIPQYARAFFGDMSNTILDGNYTFVLRQREIYLKTPRCSDGRPAQSLYSIAEEKGMSFLLFSYTNFTSVKN